MVGSGLGARWALPHYIQSSARITEKVPKERQREYGLLAGSLLLQVYCLWWPKSRETRTGHGCTVFSCGVKTSEQLQPYAAETFLSFHV